MSKPIIPTRCGQCKADLPRTFGTDGLFACNCGRRYQLRELGDELVWFAFDSPKKPTPYLNIYMQCCPGYTANIVGSRTALQWLRCVIDVALEQPAGSGWEYLDSEGVTYDLSIEVLEDEEKKKSLNKPYRNSPIRTYRCFENQELNDFGDKEQT